MNSEKKPIKAKQVDLVWKAFTQGKRWAFTKIYEDSYSDLYRFGLRFLQDTDKIKDLIHDLFFKLWQNKSNLSNSSNINIKAYLLKGLRGTILNYIRDEKKNVINLNEGFDLISSREDTFFTRESKQVNTRKLKEAIHKLSSKQKEAIYLHYIFKFSYKEVSEIMDIQIQSARNLVYEGLQKLREVQNDFID